MESFESSVRKRREHHNSRNGCLQCKARKVKCDEEKPKCRSCTRRATPCTYPEHTALNQLARAARVSSPHDKPETGSEIPHVRYKHGHGGFVSNESNALQANSPLSMASPSPLPLNMPHLQLLHHFIAVTSEALGGESVSREAWKSTIPQIALSHEFLMHSIFAVAALHLAHLRPERRRPYWERAVMHQDRAVELQQDAMANTSPDNADALFAFSLLVIYSAFGSLKASGSQDSEEPLAGTSQCISMIRGIRYVVLPIQQWIEAGPLAQLLSLHSVNAKSNRSFNDLDTDRYLERFLLLCSTSPDLSRTHAFDEIEQYAAAASTLCASFRKAGSIEDDAPKTPPFWNWACRLPPEFVQRLEKLHPIPLLLVAHWCVILAQVRQYWWLQGWVDHTMRQIRECLPNEYHAWLEWPTKTIQAQREKRTLGSAGPEAPNLGV